MRSMTGYGRGTAVFAGGRISIELSAVNRKQAEINLSLPREWLELEPRLRGEIDAHLSRGRMTVSVALHQRPAGRAGIDLAAARAHRRQLEALRRALKLAGEVTLEQVLHGPGVLGAGPQEIDIEAVWPHARRALRMALDRFVQMREREGRALAADLRRRAATVRALSREIAKLAPQVAVQHRAALLARITQAGLEIGATDERVVRELIFFADRSDITEELTRLRSHLDQFGDHLARREPVGRTLDFLLQELFRETNTIGNKANSLAIGRTVVAMKTELEKLREQVQNIE